MNFSDKYVGLTLALCLAVGISVSGCVPLAAGTAAATVSLLAIQDRSLGSAIDDTKIVLSLNRDLVKIGMFSNVSVKITEGRVMLTGVVPTAADKEKIDAIAWRQKGVKEVVNEIVVDPHRHDTNARLYSGDSVITAEVNTKLLLNSKIHSVNYSVSTTAGVVYVTGIAGSKKELDELISTIRHIKGVKQVVSYVRLADSPVR